MEQVYRTSIVSIISNYAMYLVVAAFILDKVSQFVSFSGFLVHTLLLIYRIYIVSRFVKIKDSVESKKDISHWSFLYTLGMFFTGTAWGISFFIISDISSGYHLIMLTIIVGLSSGEIFTLGTVRQIYLAYMLPMLIISLVWFSLQSGTVYAIATFLISVGIFYYLATAQYFSKNFKHIILEREETQELKERMELALIGNSDGIWDWDIASNSVYFSPSWKKMLGYEDHELPNKFSTWKDRIHPDNVNDAMACVKKSTDGSVEYYEGTHRLKHKSGEWIWVLDRAKTQYDSNGQAIRMIGAHTDITAAKKQQLRSTHQTQIIEQINDSVISTDLNGIIVSWNYGSERVFGYSAKEAKGKHFSMLCLEEDSSSFTDRLFILMKTGEFSEDIHLVKKSNETIYVTLSLSLLKGDHDVPINMIAYVHDITERKRAEDNLQEQKDILDYQAHHDSLTGLPNRVLFNDRLEQGIEKSKRSNTKLALLFIDLDHFKEINDSLGHIVGDEILKAVASSLESSIRKEDTLSRLGGDEFTVIIEDLEQGQDASLLAQKILNALSRPIEIENNILYISSSIGISLYPDDGDSGQNLLKYADAAMYKAKEEGRNNFQFYSVEMTELAFERVVMETNLRAALENREFVVYYQPQVNGVTNELIGLEALVRWNHPTMGLVVPSKFIALAESIGLIVDIDRYVMRVAMMQMVSWYSKGLNPGVLALNLAVKQLRKKDFISMLSQMLEDTKCKPQWLELEVTEGQIITNPEEAIKILNQISELGIDLAIDDFGTGYSSLSYLKKLPIHKVKIDQAFVRDLPEDEDDVAITRAVIALAKSLNLKVIAEGVEKKEQRDFLVKNGCENIQGYFYAKPMPAEKMKEILLEGFN